MLSSSDGQKLSILISGWPAVGKTTLAAELAKEFSFKMYSGGDILKMLASNRGYSTSVENWWDTKEAEQFMDERKSNSSLDKEVDEKLIEIIKKENAIITSYTLPWLVEDAIKFWLKGSQDNRAKRMANRDNISYFKARKIIQTRDQENKNIYRKLYGFNFGEDLSVFDFCVNTDLLSLSSLIDVSKNIVRYILSAN
ncbi:MAG TPA: cytidylate kinase family protein [Nitrososphaeraceae archaeon]